jgi:hypothetical protein
MVAVVTAAVAGGGVYVLLNQQDRTVAELEARYQRQAAEKHAYDVVKTFTTMAEQMMPDQLSKVQDAVNAQLRVKDLVDVAVINTSDTVVVSKQSQTIGTRLQGTEWMTTKSSGEQRVRMITAINGQPGLEIVAPLRNQGTVVGWVRAVFSLPAVQARDVALEDRAVEIAQWVGPLFLLVLILGWVAVERVRSAARKAFEAVAENILTEIHSSANDSEEPSAAQSRSAKHRAA